MLHEPFTTTEQPDAEPSWRAPWGIREIGFAVFLTALALVLAWAVLALVLGAFGASTEDAEREAGPGIAVVLAQVVVDALGVAAAAVLSLRRYRLSPRAWGLRSERPIAFGWCFLTLVAAFGTFFIYASIVRTLGLDTLEPESNVPQRLFDQPAVVPFTLLLVVVVAPLSEELFFRGFVFTGLRGAFLGRHARVWSEIPLWGVGRPFGVVGAAVASGLMWSAIHGQVGLVIPIALIGVWFALLSARTGSLWNAILVHAAFNAIGVVANYAGG